MVAQSPPRFVQKAFVSLALVALLIIPLSLGFLLSRALAPLPLADKASVAGVLQQASLASTPQTVPAVHPPGGNTIPPYTTPFFSELQKNPHQRNGHGNGNGNGNGNGKGRNGRQRQWQGHGNGHGNGHGHG